MEFAVISQMLVLWKRVIPAMAVLLISAAALGQSIQLSGTGTKYSAVTRSATNARSIARGSA